MRMMPTGRTIATQWNCAPDDAARRELLNEFQVRVVLHPRGALVPAHNPATPDTRIRSWHCFSRCAPRPLRLLARLKSGVDHAG
jgi:hypothetical protein